MSTQYQSSRDVPTEVLAARLKELAHVVAQKRDRIGAEFTMRIPAECDRDADLVMSEAARRLSAVPAVQRGVPEETINAVISLVKDAAAAHLNSEFGSCLSKIRKLLYTAQQPSSTTQGEPVAWLPYLTDRADGVTGHYAIARKNPAGYREVWNLRHHHWAAFSDEVLTKDEALAILKKLEMPTAPPPAPVQVPDKSNLHDKLIFVGHTNGWQILYANDYGHGAEGLFFKDTDGDCVIPLYMLRTHYHRLESTSFGQVTLALLNKAQRDTSQPAEQAKPTRQYYYRMGSCMALSPGSDQCICWHNEGEGPLADGSAKHWRGVPIKPTEQQPAPDMPGLTEALRQYQHNDGSGLVFGYDKILVDQYVTQLVEALLKARSAVATLAGIRSAGVYEGDEEHARELYALLGEIDALATCRNQRSEQ